MPDDVTPEPSPPQPPAGPHQQVWNPHAIMRDRAAATRRDRDNAIADLKESMSSDQLREEFGIDLDEIES